MPWTAADAQGHTAKADTPKKRRGWAKAANARLKTCRADGGDQDECEASAIKVANQMVANIKEQEIETASEVLIRTPVLVVPVDGADVPMSELIAAYREAKTKTVAGKVRPAGDFLVVEDSDKPTTWHLPVKVNGKPDHRLMGGAWAALHGGYRGNKYEGPGKAAALAKLRALYKSEDMPLPVGEFDFSEAVSAIAVRRVLSFLLKQMDDENEGSNDTDDETKEMAEVELAESAGLDADGNAPVGSAVIGRIVDFQERKSDDEPAYLDLVPVSPGWGNPKDNNYYDLPILCKFAHVWNGAKMWATDHKRADKNALNQISEVIESPVRYTDDGVPIARAVILSPEFEEVVRRRKAAGRLHTLHCSILAEGTVLKKPYKKDNRTGRYVISIAKENAGIDWVTRAGAGGHALNLAEAEDGGNDMSDKEQHEQEEEAPVSETQETVLSEAGQEQETLTYLAEAEVKSLLEASSLPKAAQERLATGEYLDEAKVKGAIAFETRYLKEITGSGKPFGQGGAKPPEETRISEADVQKRFDAIDRRHGLYIAEEVE